MPEDWATRRRTVRVFFRRHLLLAAEQGVDDLEVLLLAGAAGQQEAGRSDGVGRGQDLAEDVADLSGVHVLLFESGPDVGIPGGAVHAGDGGVLDHRDRRIGAAKGHLAFGDVRAAAALAGGQRERGAGSGERQGVAAGQGRKGHAAPRRG
jgi:hypothetical protein